MTCDGTSVVFVGLADNFPNYAGSDLTLGTCVVGKDFKINADFKACNLAKIIEGNFISFVGILKSRPPTTLITRRRPISIKLKCTYNGKSSKTAGASVVPHLGEITGDFQQSGVTIDLYLNLLDSDGKAVSRGNDLEVQVGEVVLAEVGGPNLATLGMKAYATNCYATPDSNRYNALKWFLIRKNCVIDDTFKVTPSAHGQRLSFESFSFTDNVAAKVFLHCELIACPPDAGCGKCDNQRRRRSIIPRVTQYVTKTIEVKS